MYSDLRMFDHAKVGLGTWTFKCRDIDLPVIVCKVWSYKRFWRNVGFEFQFYFLRYLFGVHLAYKGKSVSGLGVTVAFSFRVCYQGSRLCFVVSNMAVEIQGFSVDCFGGPHQRLLWLHSIIHSNFPSFKTKNFGFMTPSSTLSYSRIPFYLFVLQRWQGSTHVIIKIYLCQSVLYQCILKTV